VTVYPGGGFAVPRSAVAAALAAYAAPDPDRLAALLDAATTNPTAREEGTPMEKTPNPYDRRRDRARPTDGPYSFTNAEWRPLVGAGPVRLEPRQSLLRLDDLEAVAQNVAARTEVATAERLEQRHAEELADARRRAWDDGQAAGARDGGREARRELLLELDDQALDKLRHLRREADAILRREKATREDLRGALEQLAAQAEHLEQRRAVGFAGDL
jgi:hypothetical protein